MTGVFNPTTESFRAVTRLQSDRLGETERKEERRERARKTDRERELERARERERGLNERKQDIDANRTRGGTRTPATSMKYVNERRPERDKLYEYVTSRKKDKERRRGGERDRVGERRRHGLREEVRVLIPEVQEASCRAHGATVSSSYSRMSMSSLRPSRRLHGLGFRVWSLGFGVWREHGLDLWNGNCRVPPPCPASALATRTLQPNHYCSLYVYIYIYMYI